MIPISDDNPTLRTPVMTYAIIAALAAVWVFVQGAGADAVRLIQTVCDYGMVPGELTKLAPVGAAVDLGQGMSCVVDQQSVNAFTPLTSMFLHGGWMHLIGNAWFLWIFGNNVEDSMGRGRFLVFYLVCGLAAAATQTLIDPSSIVPMVGASGAISGVMGAYLVLYPRVRVNMFFFFMVWAMPAYLVLLWWIGLQLLSGLPQLGNPAVGGAGVAFWAHIGGFVAGMALVKLFENRELTALRNRIRRQFHPSHP